MRFFFGHCQPVRADPRRNSEMIYFEVVAIQVVDIRFAGWGGGTACRVARWLRGGPFSCGLIPRAGWGGGTACQGAQATRLPGGPATLDRIVESIIVMAPPPPKAVAF